jgi:hypothetical protein
MVTRYEEPEMNGTHFTALAAFGTIFALQGHAATYTYDLNGADGLSGAITTNCNNCLINSSDVLAWALIAAGDGVSVASTGSDPQIVAQGSAMVATPSAISFAFGSGAGFEYVGFLSGNQSINFLNELTFASAPLMFPQGGGEVDICDSGSSVATSSSSCTGPIISPPTVQIIANANVNATAAPEMDPASWVGALTLLMGTLAVMNGRAPRSPEPSAQLSVGGSIGRSRR